MTDIKALVAELREYGPRSGKASWKWHELMTEAADALEAQQAVVEAAREVCGKGSMNCIGAKRVRKALAALDAPPEGTKP